MYKCIVFYLLIFLCTFLVAEEQGPKRVDDQDLLYAMVDKVRQEHSIRYALLMDNVAAQVSHEYAQALFPHKNLAHIDVYGRNAVKRYRSGGGSALATGEILGRGPSLESIIAMWLKSPTHRRVLLDPKWTAVGAGVYQHDNVYVATVLFTTSISEDRRFVWNGDNLEVEVKLREGLTPEVWLQAGSINTTPVAVEENGVLKFVLSTDGPERCLIFNSLGQGDLLIVPPRYD